MCQNLSDEKFLSPSQGLNDQKISKTLSEASEYNAVLSMNVTLVTFAPLSISSYTAAPLASDY